MLQIIEKNPSNKKKSRECMRDQKYFGPIVQTTDQIPSAIYVYAPDNCLSPERIPGIQLLFHVPGVSQTCPFIPVIN